jgi:hypothetical protein
MNVFNLFPYNKKDLKMKEFDFHGMTTKEVLDFLIEFDATDTTTKNVKFITGRGNHSKRPQMDYYCEKEWKCPLKKVVMEYIVHEKKQGALMTEYPAYIIWRRK